MTLTVSNITGDGLSVPQLRFSVEQPDTYPDSIVFEGSIVPVPNPTTPVTTAIPITGSPLGPISPPGSGSMYYNIQVDPGPGPTFPASVAATLQSSATGDPAPITSTALVLYRFVIPTGSTNPALIVSDSTPNLWLPKPHLRVSEDGATVEPDPEVEPGEHMVLDAGTTFPGEDDAEDAPSREAFEEAQMKADAGVDKADAQVERLSAAAK